ncbi:MAG: hypothetical protein AAGI01_09050 [Myxococcota bacterium]
MMRPTQPLQRPPDYWVDGFDDGSGRRVFVAPMELPLWTWSSRLFKRSKFYDLPIIGAYNRLEARTNLLKTARDRAWAAFVVLSFWGWWLRRNGYPAPGMLFLGVGLWQLVPLLWGWVHRRRFTIDEAGYELVDTIAGIERVVATGRTSDIVGLEIERLDADALEVAQAEAPRDRACLSLELRSSASLCLAAGISTGESLWMARHIEEMLGRDEGTSVRDIV